MGTLIIPDGTEFICNHSFAGGSDITGAVVPDSVTEIGVGAFADCVNL